MPADRTELLTQLHELARLELDLLVRDLSGPAALRALAALQEELRIILARVTAFRAEARRRIGSLEAALEARAGGQAAVDVLQALAEARRGLAEVDAALGPSQLLQAELLRRCSRRAGQPPEPA
jgi:hypothetical protein